MFAVRKRRSERLVRFEVPKDYQDNLKKSGIAHKPGETIQIEGVQAQEEVWAVSDKPGAQLKLIEILKD